MSEIESGGGAAGGKKTRGKKPAKQVPRSAEPTGETPTVAAAGEPVGRKRKKGNLADEIKDERPHDRDELRAWLAREFGITVSDVALVGGNCSPLDYLAWSFFEESRAEGGPPDAVVWANRGGGKTFYAAAATALDLIFKPGIEVMILGGSLQQARRVHEHLRGFFEKPRFASHVEGRITERGMELVNGSRVELLAQSHRSVRGARPQKLRCDEVELFDPDVWRAAQLVTRSKVCGGVLVHGCVEALSTWHVRGGLMGGLIAAAEGRRIFKWGVVDVLERCEAERACPPCPLLPECGGKAKEARGHIRIDDAIVLKRRSDEESWASEMLCVRPSQRESVYPEFSRETHVRAFEVGSSADGDEPRAEGGEWVLGMDFGYAAPAVVLWGFHDAEGVLWIMGERVKREAVLERHAAAILNSAWPGDGLLPAWVGIDPAGLQRSEQTGKSAAKVLRETGLTVRAKRLPVEAGLRLVRARLAPACGGRRLVIHPRCVKLIESLEQYRYATGEARGRYGGRATGEPTPEKDGADHAADALRYLVVNLDGKGRGASYNYTA